TQSSRVVYFLPFPTFLQRTSRSQRARVTAKLDGSPTPPLTEALVSAFAALFMSPLVPPVIDPPGPGLTSLDEPLPQVSPTLPRGTSLPLESVPMSEGRFVLVVPGVCGWVIGCGSVSGIVLAAGT